jgi:predicted transcriptional regulator
MADSPYQDLSRRERQIMAIVFARGRASASEVVDAMPDAPSRTAVRTLLRILEEKGHLKHSKKGREFIYSPTKGRSRAGRSAFRHVLETFFGGSLEHAVATYLSDRRLQLSGEELNRLAQLINESRKRGC